MKLAKQILKTIFGAGKRPQASDFANLMDSFVHLDDQAAVDAQVIAQRIASYDADLKTRNLDGKVNSLGDLTYLFQNYPDSANLQDKLNSLTTAASWNNLPNKPATIAVTWDVQYLETLNALIAPLGAATSGSLVSGVGHLTGSFQITDLKVTRYATTALGGTAYLDQIIGVNLAINPRIRLA